MAQDRPDESTQSDDGVVEFDRLPLHKRADRRSWYFNLRSLCEAAGIETGEYVWLQVEEVDPDTGEKALAAAQIPDPADDEIERERVRKVVDEGSSWRITIPHNLLEELGISLESYNRDDPVMFGPFADPQGALYFVPLGLQSDLREADGDQEGSNGSPPGASSPIDESVIRQVATTMQVDVDEVGDALEVLDIDVQEDLELVGDPIETTVDQRMRTVCFVATGTLSDLVADLGFDSEIAEAVRQVHNRFAEQLLLEAEPESATFGADGDAIVVAGPAPDI